MAIEEFHINLNFWILNTRRQNSLKGPHTPIRMCTIWYQTTIPTQKHIRGGKNLKGTRSTIG